VLNRFILFFLSLTLASVVSAIELSDEQRAEIEARIKPVADVCVEGENCGGLPATAASSAAAASGVAAAAMVAAVDGAGTYNMACMACHASGAGGAPIVGNAEQWAPRIAKGTDALYASGLNGIAGTSMMAKGGRADLSDEAVMAAVDHMIANSQ
jgi:cytochrome c5